MYVVFRKDITYQIGVSIVVVKFHLQHNYEKLHVHSRTERH